jgi:hypothetical protein
VRLFNQYSAKVMPGRFSREMAACAAKTDR